MNLTEKEIERLVNNFPHFLAYCYHYLNIPCPTPLQHHIAEILDEGFDRLILEAARGIGKSWIAACYVAWRILRNNNEKVLIVSANSGLAIRINEFIRKLFSIVPLLQHLEPGKLEKDSAIGFNVKGCKPSISNSVSAVGVLGQYIGNRASLIIADDIEIDSNSATTGMREKLMNKIEGFEPLLIPDMKSSVLFLGTPQSLESIYNKLPYKIIVLPAQVPDNIENYNGKLDPWILEQGPAGTPTDKVRFPIDKLNVYKAGFTSLSGYKLQYMLDTTLSDAEKFPLKLKDLITYSLDNQEAPATITHTFMKDYIINELPNYGFSSDYYTKPLRVSDKFLKYDKKIISIDPSGQGSDETAYAVFGILNGNVFLLDVGGTSEGYSDEALKFLANKAKEYEVHRVVIERNLGGGVYTALLEKVIADIYPCTIDETISKGQKELRIIKSIEPLSTNHRLIINYNIIEKEHREIENNPKMKDYSFIYQYTHLTRFKKCLEHDDRLDAVAIGCEYIKDMLVIDAEEELKRVQEEELQAFLDEKIYGNFTGSNSSIFRR